MIEIYLISTAVAMIVNKSISILIRNKIYNMGYILKYNDDKTIIKIIKNFIPVVNFFGAMVNLGAAIALLTSDKALLRTFEDVLYTTKEVKDNYHDDYTSKQNTKENITDTKNHNRCLSKDVQDERILFTKDDYDIAISQERAMEMLSEIESNKVLSRIQKMTLLAHFRQMYLKEIKNTRKEPIYQALGNGKTKKYGGK